MKRELAFITLALALTGCSLATAKLDDATGTTKAQRCVDYLLFLSAALLVQETSPTESRAARIKGYRMFIAANCAG